MRGSCDLEVLTAPPAVDRGRPPVLFVHGAFAAAWVWQVFLMPRFAAAGYPANAVSLRGHGGSAGHGSLPLVRLSDYVDDLAHVAAGLDRPPVLVGHSMGGMVVQHYLARGGAAAGLVLMASVPPEGLRPVIAHMAWTDPALFWELGLIQSIGPHVATLDGMRRAMFGKAEPAIDPVDLFRRMDNEAPMVSLDMMLGAPLAAARSGLPALVLGAQWDAFLPRWAVQRTARRYGTEARLLPRTGHAMMLCATWPLVADTVIEWLNGLPV